VDFRLCAQKWLGAGRSGILFECGTGAVEFSASCRRDDEEFGLGRLEKLIVQHQEKSAQKILEVIYHTIFAFGNQTKWQDDITVVVIKKLGS
jgi:serine phosphatase RsbU (regulator of sigma subunit)